MSIAPVIIFVYNRPDLTKSTLLSLSKNTLASMTELIIISDGPKTEYDEEKIAEVRRLIKSVTEFKSVEIIERETNYGLSNSIIEGVTGVLNIFDKVIVLEDDLVTSPYFLKYMNDALNLYEDEEDAISIHGFLYPIKTELPESFFIRGADCWGWATWKEKWNIFEPDGRVLLNRINELNLKSAFDFDGTANYYRMLQHQVQGKVNSWAVRWYASAFLAGKYTLYPGKTLVNNIGFDKQATHTKTKLNYNSELSPVPVDLKKIPVEENQKHRKLFSDYFEGLQGGIFHRSMNYLKYLLSKL